MNNKMYIKKLEQPDLKITKMNVDDIIDEKLTKYEMIEDCFSKTSFNLILGKMGSGKTSLIVSMFSHPEIFKKSFNHIYLVMPQNSRASLKNNIFEKYLPEDQIFDDLNFEVLHEIYHRCSENAQLGENSCLIIDDFQHKFKDPEILNMIQKIILKMRHIRCTIFLLQQNFQALPKSLRELTSNIITYNLGKSQMYKIFEELIELDKNKYNEIIDLVFKNKYDWLVINLKTKNMYSKFDKIIF